MGNVPSTDGEPLHQEVQSPTPSDKLPSQSSPTTTAIPTHTTEDKSTQARSAWDFSEKAAKTPAKEILVVQLSATELLLEWFHGELDVLKPNTQEFTPVSTTTSTGSTPTPNKLLFDMHCLLCFQ